MSDGCGPNCGAEHDHTISEERGVLYSLYHQINMEKVTCLNEAVDGSGKAVFKPWADRLDRSKFVQTDADPGLLFNIPFTGIVGLKGIILFGGEEGSHPARMRLFKDRPGMRFEDTSIEPDQSFDLARDESGTLAYILKDSTFSSLTHLSIHIPDSMAAANSGEVATKVYYVGLLTASPYIEQLRPYLANRSRWSRAIKPAALTAILQPDWRDGTATKKRPLTEFSQVCYVEAIMSNLVEVEHGRIRSTDLAAVLRALVQLCDGATREQCEAILTILVHLSKTVSKESKKSASHTTWFIKKIVRKQFFDSSGQSVARPVIGPLDPGINALWNSGHFRNNVALLLSQMPLPDDLATERWNAPEIGACLARANILCCELSAEGYGGFTMLRDIGLNLAVIHSAPGNADAGLLATQRTLHKARTLIHESGHLAVRSLCLRSPDLNFSTPPKNVAAAAEPEASNPSIGTTSRVAAVRQRIHAMLGAFGASAASAAMPDAGVWSLAESGFQAEMFIFGGVFNWHNITKASECPLLFEIGQHVIRSLIETRLELPSASASSAAAGEPRPSLQPGEAIFGSTPRGLGLFQSLRNSCIRVSDSDLKHCATFGVLCLPERTADTMRLI